MGYSNADKDNQRNKCFQVEDQPTLSTRCAWFQLSAGKQEKGAVKVRPKEIEEILITGIMIIYLPSHLQ